MRWGRRRGLFPGSLRSCTVAVWPRGPTPRAAIGMGDGSLRLQPWIFKHRGKIDFM